MASWWPRTGIKQTVEDTLILSVTTFKEFLTKMERSNYEGEVPVMVPANWQRGGKVTSSIGLCAMK